MRGLAERFLSFSGAINYSACVVSHFHPYYIAGTQPEHLSPVYSHNSSVREPPWAERDRGANDGVRSGVQTRASRFGPRS